MPAHRASPARFWGFMPPIFAATDAGFSGSHFHAASWGGGATRFESPSLVRIYVLHSFCRQGVLLECLFPLAFAAVRFQPPHVLDVRRGVEPIPSCTRPRRSGEPLDGALAELRAPR